MKIGIIALLQNLDPAYSIATVVKNQIDVIQAFGHQPVLITTADSSIKSHEVHGAEIRAVLPVWPFVDYASDNLSEADKIHVEEAHNAIELAIADIDHVIEHDCILQGWFLPYGHAINRLDNIGHVIHSVPNNPALKQINPTHRILVLNDNQIEQTRASYSGFENVTAIPNHLDIREYLGFHEISKRFIKDWNLLKYDYIFTYPFSATRWGAKGVSFLSEFTIYMRNQGYKVALVLLLGHARKLTFNFDDGHLSNAMYDEYKDGVPREVVRDFMLLSDGFFFPSHSELSPLVHMEAALAKNPIYINRMLKLTTKAKTVDMTQQYNWNFEILMRDFFESTKHLDEFRRVRKEMNRDVIGKKLIDWMAYAKT